MFLWIWNVAATEFPGLDPQPTLAIPGEIEPVANPAPNRMNVHAAAL